MNDVYTGRRNQKKMIMMVGGIVVVVVIAIVAFFLLTGDSKKTLKEYYKLLSDQKYEEMYTYLDQESQSQYSKEDFINRNQNI